LEISLSSSLLFSRLVLLARMDAVEKLIFRQKDSTLPKGVWLGG
jgi:hypothetical protein